MEKEIGLSRKVIVRLMRGKVFDPSTARSGKVRAFLPGTRVWPLSAFSAFPNNGLQKSKTMRPVNRAGLAIVFRNPESQRESQYPDGWVLRFRPPVQHFCLLRRRETPRFVQKKQPSPGEARNQIDQGQSHEQSNYS